MEDIKLYNDVSLPILGLGTYMLSPEEAFASVYEAIRCGYRMIDTANAYMNEEAVGAAVKKAIEEGITSRSELFISTKLWPTMYRDAAVEKTLKRLGLEYVDLLFIHQPAGDFIAGYKQLEDAYEKGLTRSVGISNMYGEKLDKLLELTELRPHVVQAEAHPYFTQSRYMERMSAFGTRLMGWYPLGHGDRRLIDEPIFTELGAKYHKTNAQIILRWHTQKGYITIPGSREKDHIRANIDIFDFRLTDEEMKRIAALDGRKRYYEPDAEIEERYAHMLLGYEND